MFRRSLFIISLFLLLSGIVSADNRPYTWTAWLRYGRHMTLINSAGESLREVELPLPESYSMWETEIAVSPSGHLVAYPVSKEAHTQIMVYDTEKATTLVQYPLTYDGNLLYTSWYAPSEQMFNEDETELAFGYTVFHVSSGSADWVLIVLNLTDSIPSTQLKHIEGVQNNEYWTPFIRRYQGTEITFTMELLETDGAPTSFVWNIASDDVRPTVAFPSLDSVLFPSTGEVITPMFGGHPLAIPELNNTTRTLDVYDPIIGGRYPFYQFNDNLREQVAFVQNGELILMHSAQAWTLVGRDGVMLDQWNIAPNLPVYSIKSVPDGFLYTTGFLPAGEVVSLAVPNLTMVNTRNGYLNAGESLWHLSTAEYGKRTGNNSIPLEIVWVHSDAPVGPFTPWAQLSEPVYEPTPSPPETLPQPTLIPTPPPLFQVGMTVTVQTTGGEILNLRTDHTRKGEVIMYLEDDMKLTLLEGPVENEGFTWWRVRTEEGIEGWTVENNGELQTLMPGGMIQRKDAKRRRRKEEEKN